MLDNFQIFNPLFRQSISSCYLGNMGMGAVSNLYFARKGSDEFIFGKVYHWYNITPFNINYYNTKKPYTNIFYSNGSGKEQRLRLLHTQNINNDLNFGVNYNIISSEGKYLSQKTNNSNIVLFTSLNKKRYSLYASGIINRHKIYENGGIEHDSYITDSTEKTNMIPVNMSTARSLVYNRHLFLSQKFFFGKKSIRYDTVQVEKPDIKLSFEDTVEKEPEIREVVLFDPKISIGHTFHFRNDYRRYYDDIADTSFYENVYFDSTSVNDSVYYRVLRNSIHLQKTEDNRHKLKFGIDISAGNELNKYVHYDNTEYSQDSIYTLYNFTRDSVISNSYFSGSIFRRKGQTWNWYISGKYYFSGYREGDFRYIAGLRKFFRTENDNPYFSFDISYKKRSPEYYYQKFYSNHIKWDTTFLDREKTMINLSFKKPAWHLNAGIQSAILYNYIYFDSLALPAQSTTTFNIHSLYLDKDIILGNWHFNNRLVYQTVDYRSEDDFLKLPEFISYHSVYYDRWINFRATGGKLRMRIGCDIYYSTQYYAYAFMPATDQFYYQGTTLMGNYPYIDVFASIRLKRACGFFKVTHVNKDTGTKNYFTALHYPMNDLSMKFGISWSFYN